MPRYRVYGRVIGSIYCGEFEADTPEEAVEKAQDECGVSFCHQCSDQCEDPVVEPGEAVEIPADEPPTKPRRLR